MVADPKGFIQELRRRKVFRVAAVYGVVGWALVEITDTTFPRLALPDWAPTLVLVLILLGFPVALVMAWALELTPEGVRRAPTAGLGRREDRPAGESSANRRGDGPAGRSKSGWTASRIAVVGAVVVLAIAGGAFVATRNVSSLESDRVAVVPFEDHSGREDLEGFGRMAAEWVTEGLVRAEVGRVVHTQTTQAVLEQMRASYADAELSVEPARVMARETSARYVVMGAYYVGGDDLRVQAEVVDGRTGRVTDAMETVTGPLGDPMAVLQSVRERLMGLVAARLDLDRELGEHATVAGLSVTPPNYDAYRHYAECLDLYMSHQYGAAIGECRLAADSTFLEPLVWLAISYWNLNQPATADSLVDLLTPRRTELSKASQSFLSYLDATLRGNWAETAKSARKVVDVYGWQFHGFALGFALYRANQPASAIDAFERMDPTHGRMREWAAYYNFYAAALHMLGEHERELEVARRGRGQHPDRLTLLSWEATALAALGRTDDAEAGIEEMLTFPEVSYLGNTLRVLGDVFLAYSQPEAAERTYRRGIRWHATRGDTTRAVARWYQAILTLRLGELEEARRRFEALLSADHEDTNAITYLGVAAALQGDTATARDMEAELAAMEPPPYDLGTIPYLRANVLAALGERKAAVAMLRRAFSEGRPHSYYDAIDPEFANLRGYPPFEELIRPKG